jgi:hypothetical protein
VLAYSWSFGDGHGGARPDPAHAFLSLGTFTVTLRITDSWGNWTNATRLLSVRKPRPPEVTLSGSRVRGSRATVWFGSDAAIATFQCRLDGRAWVGCRSPFKADGLSPGGHRLYVRARDTFRQLGRPHTYTFTVG